MNNKDIIPGIVEEVRISMKGRICDKQNNVATMASYTLEAGHGDHLEIGTLFGGSAIVVALLKKWHFLDGKVYCVDPLDGFYFARLGKRVDPDLPGKLRVDRAALDYNIRQFGVEDRMEVIEKPSIPWPDELKGKQFVSAYIDGDHWGNTPTTDWENVKDNVTRFVIFDDYDKKHPSVIKACELAAEDPNWKTVWDAGITYVLEREKCK